MADQDKRAVRRATEAELRWMKPLLRAMSWVHRGILRASGWRLGTRFPGGGRIGLLTTTGRKSGKRRSVALLYLPDGDRVVLVASQGGSVRDPLWYQNLVAQPEVEFEAEGAARKYRARRLSAEEKAAYWPRLCAMYGEYESYQRRTDRDIPVVLLSPI